MIKVGVTGGIGSGKTTVCKIFESLGVPVYYADSRARYLMENDEELIAKIRELFGEEAYSKDLLNRAHISKLVFEDKDKLKALNDIVHPAVFEDSQNWMKRHEDHDYVIKEAALLIQAGSYKHLDFVILVIAPEETRIKRVVKRDHVNDEEVKKRIQNQWTEAEMSHFADYSITNDGHHLLIPQVLTLHEVFKKLANPLTNELS